MNVVVISDVFGTKAGAQMATLLLCRALADLDINVTCFSTWAEPDYPVASERFVLMTPLISRGHRWDWPNHCLAKQSASHVARNNPAMTFVVGVTRLCRYLLKSLIADQLFVWELTNACGNKFVDLEASKLLSRCRAMLSPSATIDANIREHYKFRGTIQRLPFWVEDLALPFSHDPEQALADFIYLGRRDEEKGLCELIKATAVIRNEFPSVKVIIGGTGNSEPFASLARDFGVQDNIIFKFFKERSAVFEALIHSKCLILPSYHEGYPLVLLEAAQSSLPFIATDVGSVREVFGESEACVLIQSRDTQSLAQGMRQILNESADAYGSRRRAAYALFQELSSQTRVSENLRQVVGLGK